MDALSQYIPGLQMQLQSPNNPGFVIRGITSDDGDSRVQPRVSVFQDGVSVSRARGAVVELFDMERIEVVKGPQGTLFGRAAQIGAVHMIQKKPVDFFSGELKLAYGNYSRQHAAGFLNTPIVKDILLNRFAFSYTKRDGFVENLSGGDLNGKNTMAFRDVIRLKTGNNGKADLIFNYQHDDYPGTAFKSKAYAPKGGDTDPWSPADLEQGEELGIDRDVWGPTLLIDQNLGDRWALSSISAYRYFHADESFDADGTAAPALWFSEIAEGKQASQEIRFNYDNESNLSGFLGVNYFWEDGSQEAPLRTNEQNLYTLFTPVVVQQINANQDLSEVQKQYLISQIYQPLLIGGEPVYVSGIPDISSIFGQLSGVPLGEYHEESQTNYGTNHAVELFADGTWKLTQRLSLTAGLRGTYEKQTGGYRSEASKTPSPLGFLMNNYPNILFPASDGKISASKDYFSWVGRLAVNYMFHNNNVYANVARGRRSGVIDIQPDDTTFLDPEIVWSCEAGIKGVFMNGKFNYDFSAYYYDWNNFQTTVYSIETGGLGEAKDAGKAHSIGLETGLRYNFYNGSSLFVGYGFIDGQFNDKDEDGNPQEYAGNTFRLTPKHSFSAGLDVNSRLANYVMLYFRPNYTYKSKVYFEDTNDEALTQDGYGLVNLTAGFRFNKSLKYQIGFYGKNLLDEKFIIDAGNTGNAFGIPTFIAGARRLMGVELKVSF
jgi:outer membrane receptor protein involved in Fe transport